MWLLDTLYLNVSSIRTAPRNGAQVLFRFKNAELHTVTKDAENLFAHFGGGEEAAGWDSARQCRWKVRKTADSFESYPVLVVDLTEYYPKRRGRAHERCWFVRTELGLSLEEVREAAHQRWQIEDDVFKRASHLSGTKRFLFRDHRQFFYLLRLFLTAIAVLDYIFVLLRAKKLLYAVLRDGIKGT